ncbi:type VI secretion protein [Chromobacterium sp. ATCC 53434]|uniref:DUF2169 family type VI secretion system accessory protein n=1 Tax=Chromobacterium sp. (strain ATCC 53434 / SC 14030) TaxID=2059672 RepID=UPI000C7906FA|nr:pentapeptide repeat-containing protein [Chromobacterium sp. ATCC 53434]AUH51026.1 type VI secretion protein [Chromobacterium sp. ATCC 53434]
MPLRHIKPQAALISTSRTQIGPQAMLRIGVGIGFRLSDPRILAHETACWEAIKAAQPSLALFEPAMPKLHAEWLLLGSSTYHGAAEDESWIDWLASAELAGVRKTVSCRAFGQPAADGHLQASLAIDHRYAAAGAAAENPFGLVGTSPPLQQRHGLGDRPSPLAAMGPLGCDWPERKQWQPRFAGSVEAMAGDGTHMGWPAATDLRIFQQAAPDQWLDEPCWPADSRYLLRGFGDVEGQLPAVQAIVLASRSGGLLDERPALSLQTIWLLPDADLGVMWWNGALPLEYVLDDGVDRLVVGFKDRAECLDFEALATFAERRGRTEDQDPLLLADHALMPDIDRGWVWEQILDKADHPRFSPPPRRYGEVHARLEQGRETLRQAHASQAKLQAFVRDRDGALASLPQAPRDETDWRAWLRGEPAQWKALTIRDADLNGFGFERRELRQVRFERCRLDHSHWKQCLLEEVLFVDCSMAGVTMDALQWKGGRLTRCNLGSSIWNDTTLDGVGWDDCRLNDIAINGGEWKAVTLQGEGGAGGRVNHARWRQVSWCQTRAEDWCFNDLQADGLGLMECRLTNGRFQHCRLLKFSALATDLTGSHWQRCHLRFAVLSHGSALRQARLEDCELISCSWQELLAEHLRLERCACLRLHAQRLKAPDSLWLDSVLDGMNAMHAQLQRSRFENCALNEALFYGADLDGGSVTGCNLIDAKTAWMRGAAGEGWHDNLETGRLEWPKRAR